MLFGETVLVAFASLRANKLRSLLTMLGIVIGVAAVIAAYSRSCDSRRLGRAWCSRGFLAAGPSLASPRMPSGAPWRRQPARDGGEHERSDGDCPTLVAALR